MNEFLEKIKKNSVSKVHSDEKIERTVFNLLLNSLDVDTRMILERSALPHWFDKNILNVLLDDKIKTPIENITKKLLTLSFVKVRADKTYVLHEQVRERLLAIWHSEREKEYLVLSKRLCEYFNQTNKRRKNTFVIRAEALYHHLVADPKEGLIQFQNEIENKLEQWQLTKVEHLLQLGQEQLWALRSETNLWLNYYKGELSLYLADFKNAEHIFNDLLGTSLPMKLRARVLYSQGSLYIKTGKSKEGEAKLLKAALIQEKSSDV